MFVPVRSFLNGGMRGRLFQTRLGGALTELTEFLYLRSEDIFVVFLGIFHREENRVELPHYPYVVRGEVGESDLCWCFPMTCGGRH